MQSQASRLSETRAGMAGGGGHPMQVWMAARATGNPYLTLLVAHLEERGLKVHCTEPQGNILRDMWGMGRPDVLHFH